jgi:hypothetical protein
MEQQLQFDPRTKQYIKDLLYDFLYTPVVNQFKLRLDTIIIRNTLLAGYGHRSFNYKGETYSVDTGPMPRVWNRLVPALKPQMDEYLKDLKELNDREVPLVLGFINQVLNSSNHLNDYLRIFPDSAHSPIEKLIATCPCQAKKLSDERVTELKEQNSHVIGMMKARMVTNLLI